MSKLRKSAKGRECTVRLPCCNHDPETVVLAHLPGGGMGLKRPDIHGAYACSACHDAIDGRVSGMWDRDWLRMCHIEAVLRTQEIMLREGLIRC